MGSSAKRNSSVAAPASTRSKKKVTTTTAKKHKDVAASGRSSPSKGPVRLSPEVLRTAAQFAELSHRSVPNQIEYWSKLGQLLECALTASEVHQLLAGKQRLGKVEVQDHVHVGSIVELVEKDRASGSIREGLSQAEYIYDTDSENRLRRTDREGNVAYGKLVASEFVEIKSPV